ncbi:hypothetical protein M422DRAFT_129367, partial [Sphaerobolus stellatus SS14]
DLHCLVLADYFLDIFYKRASHYSIILPKMCFNVKGAFLGVIDDYNVPDAPLPGVTDTRSMIYKPFLATPLLQLPSTPQELRFTDMDGIGNDETELNQALNTFMHATLVDSNETVLVADLQG